MNKNKSLLPWYVNHTISDKERKAVELWLQRDSDARADQKETRQLAQIINNQEENAPPSQVRINLLAQVREQPLQSKVNIYPWIWAAPLMLLIFGFLWLIIQPGTRLSWSTSGTMPGAFRIYRAPVGSGNFTLIEELPASPTRQTYQYADLLVVPGQNYQYIIEIRDQGGSIAMSQIATSNSLMTFAAQIAILLTSFMLTFGIVTITQEIKEPRLAPSAV